MIDMKCPICGTILDKAFINDKIRGCPKCRNMGNIELWQELIRTRKALDVAVDALKNIDQTRSVANHKIGTKDKTLNSGIVFCWTTPDDIHNALEQITALEQKDK